MLLYVNMKSTKMDQTFNKIHYIKIFKKYSTYKYLSLMNFMYLWKTMGAKHVKINKAKKIIYSDILFLKWVKKIYNTTYVKNIHT